MNRAYIDGQNYNESVYSTLLTYNINSFHTEIDDLINTLKKGDRIIIYDTADLNLSIRELVTKLDPLRGKNIQLHVVNHLNTDLDLYLNVLESALEMEQAWLGKKTREGIEKAKLKGNNAGRPKISLEKVEEIQYLYYSKKLPLRSISEKTDISLGTVYKYVKKGKHKEFK